MHFRRIAKDIDVAPLLAQIDARPGLWNLYGGRTNPGSPHYGVDDIWVRYRTLKELTTAESFREPHFAVCYPAWHVLSALQPIVFDLMARTRAFYLGGILITRIPPGGEVKPHHDRGSWHAEFCNCKVYVGLRSNPQCTNHCEDESIVIGPGEAVTFNNLLVHSVENRGTTERITAIVCMRTK